jgi:uncharacterized protein (DUF433 family)
MQTVLSRYIMTTPGLRGGKPHIAGTRITVADIAIMVERQGMAVEAVAGKYDLRLAAVYEALAYYWDNKQEIDNSIETAKAFAADLASNSESPLQKKLER